MESLYRMIKRRSFSDTDSDFALGETVQWFRQIAQAIQVLLENGHFYPTVFHLDRGNHERCYFGQWMPDVRFFEKSGLFSDRLGRLPQLAFSIADLQSVKVQQWLYLIVIYWTDALIRFNIDPYAYGLPETMDEQPAEQRFFFDSWLSHLADDPCEPFCHCQ
ncbi:hypothetical protein QS257_16140 [Terrilactibacillus sp. S3-3]|nr:hypothetical protein QS257_16140 [Terrilactibacillus sp. S3-3]